MQNNYFEMLIIIFNEKLMYFEKVKWEKKSELKMNQWAIVVGETICMKNAGRKSWNTSRIWPKRQSQMPEWNAKSAQEWDKTEGKCEKAVLLFLLLKVKKQKKPKRKKNIHVLSAAEKLKWQTENLWSLIRTDWIITKILINMLIFFIQYTICKLDLIN